MALVYQGAPGPQVRATLSVYFLFGASLSLAGVAWVGRYGATEAALTAVMVPGVLAGYFASRWGVKRIDRRGLRPAILGLSAFAGLAVLVRALV